MEPACMVAPSMSGQKALRSQLGRMAASGTMPRTFALIGERGCGKHALAKGIAEALGLAMEDATGSVSADALDAMAARPVPAMYAFDLSEIDERGQNILLKFAEEPPAEYNYVTPPAEEVQAPAAEDYRTVVHRLYANAVSGESEESAAERARPLDGIDFTDLESRAAQDGIRIRTAGGKLDASAPSDSIVHKGKALFFSGILAFLFCVALGGVVMGVRAAAGIPVFYPYLIWAIGLAVLLVTGLAYANHYGERALRRTGPVILNSVVGYILLVIVTLIVALAARADLTVTSQLINFVIIPVVFFFGVVIFGISYYLQVRPKKE